MNRKEVVFCGNSVYLHGLAAGLQYIEQFRIRMVDHELAKGIQELKMLMPDAVIFECNDSVNVNALFVATSHPLLIGVDTVQDSLVVFTGKTPLHVPADELVRVIVEYADTN